MDDVAAVITDAQPAKNVLSFNEISMEARESWQTTGGATHISSYGKQVLTYIYQIWQKKP